ncbi:hypothetical protein T440DRAFT_52397 [Plenodomus tracheiphilus IPT5]|uniref:Zn(2)-C6 fungal-type domain-containing protein n=1 Tax=Plenodomus tracheiphilus IPT5 TaxID=1408161 RepID=A0A6A7B9P4_9PLEO|nr:hypothetical protein T440DRAFT_52397 [Plenodomus tracheiphilus IPT5]
MASNTCTPGQSVSGTTPSVAPQKPQRVLACLLCQQRKVKCDRKSPCANCSRAGAQCVSASLVPRQRRRRFPERDLLDRLRLYEDLLRGNNIVFEPLHSSSDQTCSNVSLEASQEPRAAQSEGEARLPRESTTDSSDFRAKNFWYAMNRRSQDPDYDSYDSDEDGNNSDTSPYVLRQVEIKNAWDQVYLRDDHLLFCGRNVNVELQTLHPSQAHIFKLWQLYLDNVNPLLKVTHTPTLQKRMIDAASDLTRIDPPLEALMFSIYCAAVFSLNQKECEAVFGTPRQDVLRGFQLGAREALLRCDFLKSSNRDCLTALHLYLITIKPDTDPRALSSLLGNAMRIAQRMGIHNEAANARHTILEAEMRRRLWWSMVLFDSRIAEMTDLKTSTLLPTWDCQVPLDVNDFDLREEMKQLPLVYTQKSEALFAVVRSKIGDAVRHDHSHLDFVNPVLKALAKTSAIGSAPDANDLPALERMIETKYLSGCDLDNPIHYMTVWMGRVALAKAHFTHHLAVCARGQPTDMQRDASIACAMHMLECDTRLMISPLLKGYRWLVYLHFPFPAYIHLADDLKRRPLGDHASEAWRVMSGNCSARFLDYDNNDNPMDKQKNPFVKIFAGLVLQAWTARENALGPSEEPPLIVTQIKQRVDNMHMNGQTMGQTRDFTQNGGNKEVFMSDPADFGFLNSLYMGDDRLDIDNTAMFAPVSVQKPLGLDNNAWGWADGSWEPNANPAVGSWETNSTTRDFLDL